MAYRLSRALCELPASKTGKNETGGRGGTSAEMNLKAAETGGQRQCFSKALFRLRLIEALAEIRRGDGYRLAAG